MNRIKIREAAQWVDMPPLKVADCAAVLSMPSWEHIQAACFLRGFDCRGLFPVETSIRCDMGIFGLLRQVEVDAIDLGRFGNVTRKAGLQYVFATPQEWLSWAKTKELLTDPWPAYFKEVEGRPTWVFAQKNEREWLIGPIDAPVVIKRKPHASLRGIDLLHIVLSNPVSDHFEGYDAVTMEAHLTRSAFSEVDDYQVAETHELGYNEESGISLTDEMSPERAEEYRNSLSEEVKKLERERQELEVEKERYEDVAEGFGMELASTAAPQGVTFQDITVQYQTITDRLESIATELDFYQNELKRLSPNFSGKKRHTGRHKAYNATWTKMRKERDALANERGLEEFGAYLKNTVTIRDRMIGYRPPEKGPIIQLDLTETEPL